MREQLSMITGYLKKEGVHHAVGESYCSFYLETPGVIRHCAARVTVQDGHVAVIATLPIRVRGLDGPGLMRYLMHINCQLNDYMGRFELEEASGDIRFRASVSTGESGEIVPLEKIVGLLNYCADVLGEHGEAILRELFEVPAFARGYHRPYYNPEPPRWESGEDELYDEPDFDDMDELDDEINKDEGKSRFKKILSFIGLTDEE